MPQNKLSSFDLGPFIYYVSTFLGFLDPLPTYVLKHVFRTKSKQKLAFSDPPLPYKCLPYEWSSEQFLPYFFRFDLYTLPKNKLICPKNMGA